MPVKSPHIIARPSLRRGVRRTGWTSKAPRRSALVAPGTEGKSNEHSCKSPVTNTEMSSIEDT
eukprot:6173079-Pleurochrysis_carterae.AAC.3